MQQHHTSSDSARAQHLTCDYAEDFDDYPAVLAATLKNSLLYVMQSAGQRIDWHSTLRRLRRGPFRRTLFVEGGDAFLCFGGFARLHVMLEGKIDIFFHRS